MLTGPHCSYVTGYTSYNERKLRIFIKRASRFRVREENFIAMEVATCPIYRVDIFCRVLQSTISCKDARAFANDGYIVAIMHNVFLFYRVLFCVFLCMYYKIFTFVRIFRNHSSEYWLSSFFCELAYNYEHEFLYCCVTVRTVSTQKLIIMTENKEFHNCQKNYVKL